MHVCIAQNVRFMYNVIEDKAYVRHSVQQVRCLQEKQKDTGELVLIILFIGQAFIISFQITVFRESKFILCSARMYLRN